MTDRKLRAQLVLFGAAVAAVGFVVSARPAVISIYHLSLLILYPVLLGQWRSASRPVSGWPRLVSAILVAVPAARGGIFLNHLWMGAVWFALFEFPSAAAWQNWKQQVRHKHSTRRLERFSLEAAARLEEMKSRADGVQEEITLYQTVYDLAMKQTSGMSRPDILAAAGESLKELARRRSLPIHNMNLFLTSGELFDLRNLKAVARMDARWKEIKDRMFKQIQLVEKSPAKPVEPVVEGSWVVFPIRYQENFLGGLGLEFEDSAFFIPGTDPMSPTDKALLSVISDLIGLVIQNSLLYEQVNQMATTDRLTGLFVLWYFKDRMKEEVHRSHRNHRALSVLMMDLDHFKKVNDTYGHLAGDAVLREAAARIKNTLREGDFLSRYGGEEIAAFLPETTAEGAERVAERIRAAVQGKPVDTPSTPIQVTISIGINDLARTDVHEDPGLTAVRLLKGADEALYRAKHDGRNCVRIFSAGPASPPVATLSSEASH